MKIQVLTAIGEIKEDISVMIDLASQVMGILPIANGGTGASSLTGHGVVTVNSGGTALTTVAPGASGNVLTSDGTDWTSAAPTGGVANLDITATAGEAISARDLVYIKPSDNKIYKIDTDAAGPLVDVTRGIAPAAISNAASGILRFAGQVTGFSSLTAGGRMYASTTAGGYTQTKPTVSAGGSQVALIDIGYADSTTTVFVEPGTPVQYLKRNNLANNGTLTIVHHADALAHDRSVRAYVATSTTVSLTSYSDTNQDASRQLHGQSGAGGTTTITASGDSLLLGTSGSVDYRVGQSFQVTAGILSQITVKWSNNGGTPTGSATWTIETDSAGAPSGSSLATGTFTPTANSTDTITVTGGPLLASSTTYWLVIRSTSPQSNGNYWQWQCSSASSTYAGGSLSQGPVGGSWTNYSTKDGQCSITTSTITNYDKLAQGIQFSGAQTVNSATLYLAKVGTPTGTMTLRIETDSAGVPSGTLVDANATATTAESGLGTSLGDITFTFAGSFSVSGSTQYWLVLSTDRAQSNTNYVNWGVDASSPGYTGGTFATNASSTWTTDSTRDGCFDVLGGTTYEEPCVIGRWSATSGRDIAVRYDDGAGSNPDTKTTFKNVIGSTADVTVIVELP